MSVPPKGKAIDFDIVSEVWSTYRIRDRSPVLLKGRVILTKVMRTDFTNELGEPVYATGSANPVFVTFAPPELSGPPTIPPPSQEQLSKADITDVEFDRVDEPWNEYKLKDGTVVKVRVLVSNVRRTPFFVPDGDPLYIVNHDTHVRVQVPKELRQARSA